MASSACNHLWGGCLSHTGVASWDGDAAAARGGRFVVGRGCRKRAALEGQRLRAERHRYTQALRCEMASLETRALSGGLRTSF